MKVASGDKPTSLLCCSINYMGIKFYNTGAYRFIIISCILHEGRQFEASQPKEKYVRGCIHNLKKVLK